VLEKLIYHFLSAWLLGLIALIIGRYAGTSKARFPDGFTRNCVVFLKVWGVTFFAQLAFGYLGYAMRWSEAAQSGFAEFLLPIAAGAYLRDIPWLRSRTPKASYLLPKRPSHRRPYDCGF
jgi:hypothetical protein